MAKFLIYVAVYVFFTRKGQVYLMRRANTGYRDGQYSLPAGHVEKGESLVEAAQREIREEAGIDLPTESLVLKHAMYRRYPERTYADYYFVVDDWIGEPQVMEPEKCDLGLWVNEGDFPEPMVPEIVAAWKLIQAGQPFSDIQF